MAILVGIREAGPSCRTRVQKQDTSSERINKGKGSPRGPSPKQINKSGVPAQDVRAGVLVGGSSPQDSLTFAHLVGRALD